MFNLLDYCAGVLPIGQVTKQDDLNLADEKQWSTGIALNF